jgi:hypothetical protein
MKTIKILSLFSIFFSFGQTNTDIHLFDLNTQNNKISVTNHKNISNNEGYDSQPSFLDDRYIIFASTRNDQTDIAKYDTRYNVKLFMNSTAGGEYTPLKIPNKAEVSAVRLDKDGKQRLYTYNLSNGVSTELVKDLVVAYYTWYDDNNIVAAVIEGDDLNLFSINVKEGTSKRLDTKVGRSFHKIPNSNRISYISKANENQWQIRSLNPVTGSSWLIANTMSNTEDICWLDYRTILTSKESVLYKLTVKRDNNWKKVTDLSANGIIKITRLAVNPTSTKLLIAGDINEQTTPDEVNQPDPTPVDNTVNSENDAKLIAIVQNQQDAYNAKNIDAFMATYSKDIKLYNYPNELLSEGLEQMRKDYISWFERTPDLKATISDRIVIGNRVIDKERITANGRIFNTVAIYEVVNGLISKVTFMQ